MPPGGKGATCSDMGNKMKVLYVASISNLKDGTYQELDSNCSTFRDEVYVDRDDYEKAKIDVECAKGLVTSIVRQFIPQMLRLGRPPRFDASTPNLSGLVNNPSFNPNPADGGPPAIADSLAIFLRVPMVAQQA